MADQTQMADNAELDAVFPNTANDINLLIEYTKEELRYESDNGVYRVPLRSAEDMESLAKRYRGVTDRIRSAVREDRVRRVVWRFISTPAIKMTTDTNLLLTCLTMTHLRHFELDIAATAERFPLDAMQGLNFVTHPISLILRQGDFSGKGVASAIAKTVAAIYEPREPISLHIEVSRMTDLGRNAVEGVGSVLSSVTVDQLSDERLLGQLVKLINNSAHKFEVKINNFDVPGGAKVHLTRGDLSLRVGSITSPLELSCDEELAFLAIPSTRHLSAPRVKIRELQLGDNPARYDVERL